MNIEEERKKRIKKKRKIFMKALETSTEEIQLANEALIDNLSFVVVMMEDLKEHIILHGVKEEYQNGQNQKGYKESVESKSYNQLTKSYLSMMKVLNAVLPTDAQMQIDDAFQKFKEM